METPRTRCPECDDIGRQPGWMDGRILGGVAIVDGAWCGYACKSCGLVRLPRGVMPEPQHSLPTPPAQEAHTQPGESDAAAQDVRSGDGGFNWTCQLCAQEVALGEQYRTIGPGGHVIHDGAACVVAAERARIRAAVEGNLGLGMMIHMHDLEAILDRGARW